MPHDSSSRPPPSLGHVRPVSAGGPEHPRPRPAPRPPFANAATQHPPYAPRAPRPPQPLDKRPGARGAIYAALVVLGLLAVGSGLVLLYPPTDLVKQHLAQEVERQTGRKLSMGSAGVSLWSGLGVTMLDVVLSAPATMGGPPLLKADRLEVNVALLPFVLREVKIERLTLTRPVLELQVDREGRRSWDFAAAPAPGRYAQATSRSVTDAGRLPPELREFARGATPPGGPGSRAPLGLEALSLADVRVSDGIVRYSDARSGIRQELKGINARLALPQAGGALDVDGHVVVAGQRLAVEGRVDTLRELMAEQPTSLRLKVEGTPLALHYDGRVVAAAHPTLDGTLSLKAPSAAGLARLLGLAPTYLEGLAAVALDGAVKASPTGIDLTSATLEGAGSSATGSLTVDLGKAKPNVRGNLRFARLDLDRALAVGRHLSDTAPSIPQGSAGRFAAPVSVPPPGGGGGRPASIDDLLRQSGDDAGPSGSGPQVRGFRQRVGNQWDIEPIGMDALRGLDLDLRSQIGELVWQDVRASAVQVAAELKDGHLRLNVTDADVAGGKMRCIASIDARQPTVTVGASLSGDGVALAPLLGAAGIGGLEGRGRVILNVSARGASERDIVSTLAGRAELKVADGALIGWDAEAMLASLRRAEVPSTRRDPQARTPFRQLSATFQIASGVARTKDIAIDSPAMTATGVGLVNIVDRNVDLTLKPQINGGSGIEVPVRVAGPWDEPGVVPDVAAALKSPQAQQAVRQLKEGNVEGAVRSVLGDGPKTEKKIDKAKQLLRGFFNQ